MVGGRIGVGLSRPQRTVQAGDTIKGCYTGAAKFSKSKILPPRMHVFIFCSRLYLRPSIVYNYSITRLMSRRDNILPGVVEPLPRVSELKATTASQARRRTTSPAGFSCRKNGRTKARSSSSCLQRRLSRRRPRSITNSEWQCWHARRKKPVGEGWSDKNKQPSLKELKAQFDRDVERPECQAIGLIQQSSLHRLRLIRCQGHRRGRHHVQAA